MASHWTKSKAAADHLAEDAWYVEFSTGHSNTEDRSIDNCVRCVRAGRISAYTDNRYVAELSTVNDLVTGLKWGTGYTTQPVHLAGCSGEFRMPNIHELISVVDLSEYSPAVNPALSFFSNLTHSTITAFQSGYWTVAFTTGATGSQESTFIGNAARCVSGP
jgi:hypothetical protein